jgi:hypothetical protein
VGLQTDLGMTNAQFNLTLTIFFISYSVFEPATNILLKRLRPSIFIPLIMMAWVCDIHLKQVDVFLTLTGHLYDLHGLRA